MGAPPSCRADNGRCLNLDKYSDALPNVRITGMVSNWVDSSGDGTLQYEFGMKDGAGGYNLRSAGQATSYRFVGLGPGNSTLYACSVDMYGAKDCQEAAVQVQLPPHGVNATEVLAGAVNLAMLDGSQDSALLLEAAQHASAVLNAAAPGTSGNAAAGVKNGLVVSLAQQPTLGDVQQALVVLEAVGSLATAGALSVQNGLHMALPFLPCPAHIYALDSG